MIPYERYVHVEKANGEVHKGQSIGFIQDVKGQVRLLYSYAVPNKEMDKIGSGYVSQCSFPYFRED